MQLLSIIIPIFNEQDNILELYSRLLQTIKKDFPDFNYEIIFINDGSTDSSFPTLHELHKKDNNVKVVEFSRNFGHHIAITAGLDYAQGDYIVMMDGDLQDQPEEIPKLYKKLKTGYDVVYGERVNKQFGIFKKLLSKLFNFTIKRFIQEDIIINSSIFRIITKQVNENIKQLREQNRYIVGIIGWVGFNHGVQKVIHGKRFKGKSKYSLSKQISLALNAILSFSDYPLKIIVKIGLLFVAMSLVLAGYQIYTKLMYNTPVLGWTSLISAVLIVGGVNIILLGVVGLYIGRNYMEDKNRPLYIVKNKLF